MRSDLAPQQPRPKQPRPKKPEQLGSIYLFCEEKDGSFTYRFAKAVDPNRTVVFAAVGRRTLAETVKLLDEHRGGIDTLILDPPEEFFTTHNTDESNSTYRKLTSDERQELFRLLEERG